MTSLEEEKGRLKKLLEEKDAQGQILAAEKQMAEDKVQFSKSAYFSCFNRWNGVLVLVDGITADL